MMADQRICFVSLHSYGYFVDGHGLTGGGAERQLSLLAPALTDEFDVHVIVADYGQDARVSQDGVVLHKSYDPNSDPSTTERLGWLADLASTMYRVDADVYVHRGTPAFAAVVSTLVDTMGKAWVYNVANDANVCERPDDLGRVRRRLFERGLEQAAAVIAQTPKQSDLLQERYGRDAAVVPNGYPPADETVPYDDREYVLWVGRLDRDQKRPHLFSDLAAAYPETEFRLVGPPGDDEAYYQQLTSRVDELGNLRYEGTVPPDVVHDYYRRAHCLVSTSAYEGFPNTFLEAWRVGTPVLSLGVDPARIASDETLGGFADGEFERLSDAVSLLAADETARRRLGETGKRVFEERFDIETVASTYGDVLRKQIRASG